MKVIFLAPGLGRVRRGYERFVLELAAELRQAGLDAICWGSSEIPGVESLPVPARIELQQIVRDRLGADPRFSDLPAAALQDWSVYAEDQVFAIPAAHRIRALLAAGESLLVYAKWQGGLVDPSGAPTDLLKILARAGREGTAQLVVHTDYVHTPIDSLLWTAGACFHSLGSWISEPLRRLGALAGSVVELPMCIHAAAYRRAREHRAAIRGELGIPPSAFVILSVGSFDTVTPDKRHAHLLREILRLPDAEHTWWIVAGSRGPEPTAWELEARQHLGTRFVPLTNLSFEQMPRVYGAADLFALASTEETFGLVYVEAQIAGLPTLIHDTTIARDLCGHIPEERRAMSLVDMRREGVTAAAIARWRKLLTTPRDAAAVRAALDALARTQEERYGWELGGPRFAEALRKLSPSPSRAEPTERRALGGWDEQFHRDALRSFEQKRYTEAAATLARALGARETAERWNDWGAAQLALSNPAEAEHGFRRALALEPGHAQAAANLGIVLASTERAAEAIPFLEQSIPAMDDAQRVALSKILAGCRDAVGSTVLPADDVLGAYFRGAAAPGDDPSEDIPYWTALLRALHYATLHSVAGPNAQATLRLLGAGCGGDAILSALARFLPYATTRWCDPETVPDSDGARWPFADGSFDVVVLSQILETLADPMQLMAEANRVLRTGGTLLLAAANLASAQSLQALLRGDSPYVHGRLLAGAQGSTAHHREYTPAEIEALATAAGFAAFHLQTRDVFSDAPAAAMASLAPLGLSVGSRGDTIFFRAQKRSAVRDRFPAKLYDRTGVTAPFSTDHSTRPLRILIAYETLPLLDRGGADHRLMQIIRLICDQGHSLTFLAPRGYGKETYAAALRELGVTLLLDDAQVLALEGTDTVPRWTLREALREGQFDLAILSLWFWMGLSLPEYYLDEIRRLSPATRVAILTDDCHGLREAGRAELSGLWSDRERACDFAEREMEIHRRADMVVTVSPADQERIRSEVREVPVELLPMMVERAPAAPGFDARNDLVYLANFNNPASLDGLEWYLREVAPLVRRALPEVNLHLVGAGLPDEWTSTDPHVVRVGPVPDLSTEFARRRILVSPVRFGTGIKTKNLHALANGLPIVTNTMGAEGLHFVNGKTALIADDPREFANAVVRLYTDAALWRALSENSQAHIATQFSKERMSAALQAILERARDLRPKRHDPAHIWSARLVEKIFVEVPIYRPAKDRPAIRILAYARAAEQLLAQKNAEGARRQLRHTFSFVPNRVSRIAFLGDLQTVAETVDRLYREIGGEASEAFRREANLFSVGIFPEISEPPAAAAVAPPKSPAVATRRAKPHPNGSAARPLDFSVIIPSFNRSPILSECLSALDGQSLSPRRFEVIVVDDGSTDDTRSLCESHSRRYEFHYLCQKNAGPGAARRSGVERARGKYLLLINDDTISEPALLRRHLEMQRAHANEKIAVLGDFRYPEIAQNRALTHFLGSQPFLFPQVTLEPGIHASNSLFITCNLSVLREAVVAAGSFDPAFRVAEDTELGIRLRAQGFRVLYEPEARAIHRHLDFTIADLVRRAEAYGNTCVTLYQKHPALLDGGKGPFGTLDDNSLDQLMLFVEQRGNEVSAAVESLSKFDTLDFLPFFSRLIGEKNAALEVMDLFAKSIPVVFWFHIFRGFLSAWRKNPQTHFISAMETPVPKDSAFD